MNALTLTLPGRDGAAPAVSDPAGGPLVLEQTIDDLAYSIEASDELSARTLEVAEVTGAAAAAVQAGMPALTSGWSYRTFRSPGPVPGDPAELMRVKLLNTE